MAAIGKFKPRAAAGDECAERRAETAQPLQPDGSRGRQASGELCDLATVRIGRTKGLFGEDGAIGGAEQLRGHRIGPENPGAVDRPEPCGQRARRMQRQPRIANTSQLEIRIIHRLT